MTDDFNLITAADLVEFQHTIPASMLDLMKCIGDGPALAMFNTFAGLQILVPRKRAHRASSAQKWMEIENVIGAEAMLRLSQEYGAEKIMIPVFRDLRAAKLRQFVLSRFDHLTATTGPAMSGAMAVRTICMDMNRTGKPMTTKHIELILSQ